MYVSETCSLDRWGSAMARLEGIIKDYEADLLESAKHKDITLDNAELEVPRVNESRERLFQLAEQIDVAFSLRQLVQSNIARVEFESGLVDLRISISNLTKVMNSLRQLTDLAGPRIRVHQDLEHASRAFERLRPAGEGETIRSERSRLKQLVFSMPAVDPQDLIGVRDYLHSSYLALDELNSRERDILSRSGFRLAVEENFISLFNKIGIPVYDMPDPVREEAIEDVSQSLEGEPLEDSSEVEAPLSATEVDVATSQEESAPDLRVSKKLKEVFVEDPAYHSKQLNKELPAVETIPPKAKYPAPLGGYDTKEQV